MLLQRQIKQGLSQIISYSAGKCSFFPFAFLPNDVAHVFNNIDTLNPQSGHFLFIHAENFSKEKGRSVFHPRGVGGSPTRCGQPRGLRGLL